ncbi:MAG: putative porin [Flavobacterium sp.]|nr:putative porin [Flavobacterium sp.]
MRYLLSLLLFVLSFQSFSQDKKPKSLRKETNDTLNKAKINQYAIITLDQDTSYVDTSLSLKSDYKLNYLKKDMFGLLPFANDGGYYSTLHFGTTTTSSLPSMGFSTKHLNYVQIEDVNYYSVATPLTDLHFKTTQQQGQNTDVLIAVNTSPQFNFSLEYRGMRSLGKYINEQSTSGNFKFTASYTALNKRYVSNFHFTGQDLTNGENGGITSIENFESGDPDYVKRASLQVYLKDATSVLKGKRFFYDHSLRINSKNKQNNLYLSHQFVYENKYYSYDQKTVKSSIDGSTNFFNRFGDSYLAANIQDRTNFNSMYNKVGVAYENKTLGRVTFFLDDYRNNQYYDKVLQLDAQLIPNAISNTINTVGGQYQYQKTKWSGKFLFSNAISTQQRRDVDAVLVYKINPEDLIKLEYHNSSKAPNNNYNLLQSSYIQYNWSNDFSNVLTNSVQAEVSTQWLHASLQLTTIDNFLYFKDTATIENQQIIKPFQYANTINYLSATVNKEVTFRKFGLDATVLYQKVDQSNAVLNLPEITLRSTIYYKNKFFKSNLQLQTGFTVNYFTSFYANEFNPVVSEFFVQTNRQIGNFPMVDFFVNGRIRQTRIFFKAEHFNSTMTGNTFYTTPTSPYRDFVIRFGIAWNFFQ